jgi:hypothetical protein
MNLSMIIPKSKRGADPVVALNSIISPGTKKNRQRKKSNIEDYNTIVEEDLDDADMENTKDTKLGVVSKVDIDNSDDDDDDDDDVIDNDISSIPHELESDLGPYWTLTHSTYNYVLNTITSYSNIEASKSTPQYGFSQGLKEFGTLVYEATVKELDANLLGMGAVTMLKPSEVNKNIRYEALNYLMFLKRKRCGKIKARGCADGRPQREYITKDESSSPTVSIYALMTSCLMDAIEGRKVATCDIPGAFYRLTGQQTGTATSNSRVRWYQ